MLAAFVDVLSSSGMKSGSSLSSEGNGSACLPNANTCVPARFGTPRMPFDPLPLRGISIKHPLIPVFS